MDDEGQSHERPSRDEEPRRSDRKTKTKSARVESPEEEEVEDSTPQIPTVKDINKMMKIFA